MRTVFAAALAFTGLLLGGCFDDSDGGVTANPAAQPLPVPPASFKARYVPSGGVFPYPNDLYFNGSTDGTLNVQPITAFTPNAEAINALDGFSTNASIRIPFESAIDPASVAGGVNVHVLEVVVDPLTTATVGFTRALVPGVDYSVAPATDIDAGGSILEIVPLRPLTPSAGSIDPGTGEPIPSSGYLILVTEGIQDTDGLSASADSDYQAIKEALASGDTLDDPTLDGIKQLVGAHFAIASAVGIDTASVVVSFSFSTQSTTDVLEVVNALATPQVAQIGPVFAPPPAPEGTILTTASVLPPEAMPSGNGDVYAGIVQVPYYLETPDNGDPLAGFWRGGPSALDPTSNFLTRFNPVPVATDTLSIPALMTVPNDNSAFVQAFGGPPAEGWPVIIFMHGITRNRTDMFAIAEGFADAGFVAIAIDQPLHGITATDPAVDPIALFYAGDLERTFNLDVRNNATLAPGPDGLIDDSGTHFNNFESLLTTRDNYRQGSADLISLTKTVPTIDIDGDQAPDLDGERIHFVGHSLGAMVGTGYLAVNTEVRSATLAMPGGVITQLALDSPSLSQILVGGLQAAGLTQGTTLFNQWVRDGQTAIDAGDPISYATMAALNHPIHMIEVIGDGAASLPDQVIPNSATERLITEMALPQISAPGANVVSHGVIKFTAGSHGSILDPTASLAATVEMQTETVVFAAGNAAAMIPGDGAVILISDPTVIQ